MRFFTRTDLHERMITTSNVSFFFAEHDQAYLNEIQIIYTGIQI
jgi:hypothetical protein